MFRENFVSLRTGNVDCMTRLQENFPLHLHAPVH